jgi:uncharacterized membrane protein
LATDSGDAGEPGEAITPRGVPPEVPQVEPEVVEQIIRAASFYGPLPPPEWMDQYEQVLHGAANRIFELAEREQAHRHWTDRAFVWFRFATLTVAGLVAMAAIVGGIYLIANDKGATGLALILTDLVGVLVVFLVRQFRRNNAH